MGPKTKEPTKEPKKQEPKEDTSEEEEEEDTTEEEEEDPDRIEPDEINEEELKIESKPDDWEISEADDEKAWDLKNEGDDLIGEGKVEEGLKKYKEAFTLNPNSGFFNIRAAYWLKQKKPNACIYDCNQSLKCNPNSAKAHKLRGRANRLLGNYLQAYKDLAAANQCDYNPEVY